MKLLSYKQDARYLKVKTLPLLHDELHTRFVFIGKKDISNAEFKQDSLHCYTEPVKRRFGLRRTQVQIYKFLRASNHSPPYITYNCVCLYIMCDINIIIIIIFLHGLGRFTCSGIDALPSFPRASMISSSSRFVVEGLFRESGVVHSFKMDDPVLFVFGSNVLYSRDL